MRIVLVVVSLLVGVHCDAAGTCGHSSDREARTVKLMRPSDDPVYYFRTGHYVFLIPANLLVASLENQQWRSGAAERLLFEIKKDPVISRTDLFKYALIDGRYLPVMEYLIADIAEAGKVGLIDVREWTESKKAVPALTVLITSGDAYQGRKFCSPSGELLVQVIDSVM